MSLRCFKPWLRSICGFCALLFLIVISSHTTQAATTSPLKSLPNDPIVTVTLQADNGLYLSRINHGSANPIEAAKSKVDAFSKFKIVHLDNGKFTLQADNGLYLSRINYGGANGKNPIEAAKSTADAACQFTITIDLGTGLAALQANNGLYLSRINGAGGKNPIEAAKGSFDPYQFRMDFVQ